MEGLRWDNLKLQLLHFTDDEKLSFVLNATVFLLVCNAFYVQWMGAIGVEEGLPYYKYIVFLMFLCTGTIVLKNSFRMLFSVCLFVGTVFMFEYIAYPENQESIMYFFGWVFGILIPMFAYIYTIRDYEIFFRVIRLFFPVILVIILVYNFTINQVVEYSMAMGYNLLYYDIVALYLYFRERRFVDLLFFFVFLVQIVLGGSRGPLIPLAVFFLHQIWNRTNYLWRVSICACITSLVLFYQDIFGIIYDVSVEYGITSRTLALLSRGFEADSGRGYLYNIALDYIEEHPILGIGLGGGRNLFGSYVHNFFLDMWLDYGIIIGSIFILTLFYLCFKVYSNNDQYGRDILILSYCIGILPLMVSGTYLRDYSFWLMLGILFRYREQARGQFKLT